MEGGWAGLNNSAMEFFNSTAVMEAFVDVLVCVVPIWVAVMIGLMIGWSWRPRWSGLVFLGLRSKLRYVWTLPPGLGARRFWLAFTALSAFSLCRGLWFRSRGMSGKVDKSSADSASDSAQESVDNGSCGDMSRHLTGAPDGESNVVTEKDLEHLLKLLNVKNGDMAWQNMMERSTTNMHYQAWRFIHRMAQQFTEAKPFSRMQLQSLSEIFSGMMSFGLNGILCSHASIYWKNALLRG
ncbi:hypothetical protein SASPL_116633 [Salvia splendens]|uniref:Uncharacterized protein n=1 Tax=Salvia splendens TaxID=180675 RepID=A0A8X8XU85_SALSN|nr:hypothetical protein SASPL_116633 [Salvia splendens]